MRLPHWDPGTPVFLTWRLHGSLPVEKMTDLYTSEGAKFVAFDRLPDARSTGPKWLSIPETAEATKQTLISGEQAGYYELGSWVITPNHVHILICPRTELPRIVAGINQKSAKEANQILNRTGPSGPETISTAWPAIATKQTASFATSRTTR
jgi:hypothetical protein